MTEGVKAGQHRIYATRLMPVGIMLAAGLSPAHAQTMTPDEEDRRLGTIVVTGKPLDAEQIQSPKFTQRLLDTPQSITVIHSDTLREQNALSLQDVLKNVAGITFTSGEGNLGWGDFFTIRGFSSEQSVTVDGVRDGGMSSRTDIFNLQQAEVFKGTGSVESGVSAVGGSVNLVSKEAQAAEFLRASMGLGSQNYQRATIDVNKQLGDTTALRVNAMTHYNEVARRNEVNFERYGVAASFAAGLGTSTRFYLDGFHQKDDNTPDGGLPIQRGTGGKLMPGVPRNASYGAKGIYTQQTQIDTVTAHLEHDLSGTSGIRTQFRAERSDNWNTLSPARFNVANADGSQTCTGTRCATLGYVGLGSVSRIGTVNSYTGYANVSTGAYAYLRGNDFGTSKRYEILDSQTDLRTSFKMLGIKHDLTAGVEWFRERYGDHERTMLVPDVPAGGMFFDLSNPQVYFPSTTAVKGAGSAMSSVEDIAGYINDTLTLLEQWQLQTALRVDRYKATSASAGGTDTAWGGRLGLVYKPVQSGAVYVSYSRAAQPSAVGLTTNSIIYGSAATAQLEPAKSWTLEAGTKWEFFNGALGLTGAIFRTELSDSWEYNPDGTSPVRALPAKRVEGLELEAQGHITRAWELTASMSRLKSDLTKGENAGLEAFNVPDWSATLWTSYKMLPTVNISYGAQYIGKRRYTNNRYVGGLNNNASYAPGPAGVFPIYTLDQEKAPSFIVQNAAVRWQANRHVAASFNVQNLTNRFYYSRIGASLDGFQIYGVPGAGRTITGTLEFSF